LSDGALALLAHAASINALKSDNRETFSSTPILASAIDLAHRSRSIRMPPPNDEDADELAGMLALEEAIEGVAEPTTFRFDNVLRDWLGGTWQIGGELTPVNWQTEADAYPSDAFVEAIRLAGGIRDPDGPITSAVLLRAVLEKSSMLADRLAEIGLSTKDLEAAIIRGPRRPAPPVEAEEASRASADDGAPPGQSERKPVATPDIGSDESREAENEVSRAFPNIGREARRDEEILNAPQYARAGNVAAYG
jgi:hypothetical protein